MMTDDDMRVNLDELDDLLDAERAALMSGNLECLTRMVDRKEALIGTLNQTDQTDLTILKTLDAKVRRNQQLLDGALEGIRSVARRMATLRRIRSSLDTYDASGRKRKAEIGGDSSVEKRA